MEPGQAFAVGSLALNLALLLFTSLHLSARSCGSGSGLDFALCPLPPHHMRPA